MALTLVFIMEHFTGVYEETIISKFWSQVKVVYIIVQQNIMKLLIINKKYCIGWAWQYYDQIFNNCMPHELYNIYGCYCSVWDAKEYDGRTQFLAAFFPDFPLLWKKNVKKKDETNVRKWSLKVKVL